MLLLGFVVVLGMSLSAIQVNAMGMSMPGTTMSGMRDCAGCKDMPSGAKNVVCDAACAAAVVVTLPQVSVLAIWLTMDRPLFQSPMPFGWTTAPNPHPPERALI